MAQSWSIKILNPAIQSFAPITSRAPRTSGLLVLKIDIQWSIQWYFYITVMKFDGKLSRYCKKYMFFVPLCGFTLFARMYTSDIPVILCECEWFHGKYCSISMISLGAWSQYLMNIIQSAFVHLFHFEQYSQSSPLLKQMCIYYFFPVNNFHSRSLWNIHSMSVKGKLFFLEWWD